jgi:hypothetical protein
MTCSRKWPPQPDPQSRGSPLAVSHEELAPLREAAHAEGLGRGAFAVIADRTFAIAGGKEPPMSVPELEDKLVSWHGPEEAPRIFEAARALAQRLAASSPQARELLQAVGTDAHVVSTLGQAELRRAGR